MAVSGQDRLLPPDVPYGAAYSGRGLSLKSSSVDLKRSTITIEAAYAKNGRTRTVPLNSIALETLKRLKVDGEHIFVNDEGMPYRSISSIFKRACKRASLIGVTPHTFRHYICVAVGDGGSGLANGSGVGRMADPLDGRALRAPLPRTRRRRLVFTSGSTPRGAFGFQSSNTQSSTAPVERTAGVWARLPKDSHTLGSRAQPYCGKENMGPT